MKLLLENWRQYQLLAEAQDICALYESGQITEGEFLDKIKRFAKKKGIPIALAISLATSAIGGPVAQAKGLGGAVQDRVAQIQGGDPQGSKFKDWVSDMKKELIGPGGEDREEFDKRVAAVEAEKEERAGAGHIYTTLQNIEDYPLSQAPREAKQGFLWVTPSEIPDSAYLGPSSAYRNAGHYRQEISNMDSELLYHRLLGKDSGAVFGSGDSAYFVEYAQSEDGRNILPLEWSLSYEALMKLLSPEYADAVAQK